MACTLSSTPAPHRALVSCNGSRILRGENGVLDPTGREDAKGAGRSNGTKDVMRLFLRTLWLRNLLCASRADDIARYLSVFFGAFNWYRCHDVDHCRFPPSPRDR